MLDAMRTRRSIRRYLPKPIPAETIAQLQEAMLRAPSGRNAQPWRFVFVTDAALLEALSQARGLTSEHSRARASGFLAGAALGVVVCGEPSVSDTWIEDCSIAAVTLQYAATELGLASCWTQMRMREHEDGRPAEGYVREVLGLPDELTVECIVGVGYPAEEKPAKDRDALSWDKAEER